MRLEAHSSKHEIVLSDANWWKMLILCSFDSHDMNPMISKSLVQYYLNNLTCFSNILNEFQY